MPSSYLAGSDLAAYGVPNATAQQIQSASTLVDMYLERPEGLQWMPDYAGLPCYMAGLSSPLPFTLAGSLSPGTGVSVTLATASLSTFGAVGDVVIIDRANPNLCEACVITSTQSNSITLESVANTHASGATLEFGLTIREQITMPPKRSVTRLGSWPLVRLLSGLGSYRYGRRSEQQAGLYADQSVLSLMQTFGGPPEWIAWNVNGADYSLVSNELWVPSGIFLAYYSDIRVFYLAGYNQANIPPCIKQATAGVITANLATQDMAGNVKVAKAGEQQLQRFSATVLDDDLRSMLAPYRARRFV